MSIRYCVFLITLVTCTVASAGIITFDELLEGDVLTNQYASQGVLAGGNPVVYTAGSLLNEIDFPPRSGANVLVDENGPVTFTFLTPLVSVSGFFTYTTNLTLRIYSPSNLLLQTAFSSSSANFGGGANEFIRFGSSAGIGSLSISGDPLGSSFTLDNLEVVAPEPSSGSAMIVACIALLACLVFEGRGRWPGRCARVCARVARFVALAFVGAVSVFAQKAGVMNALIPSPGLVYLTSGPATPPTAVKFVVNVGFSQNLKSGSVTLTQVTQTGALVRVVGPMYDDGAHGDLAANDNNYGLFVVFNQTAPVTQYYRATAAYNGTIARSQSPIVPVSVANPSFSKPPDPKTLTQDAPNHNLFPSNQFVFGVPPGTSLATATTIAASVNGKIVGFSSSGGDLYQVELPSSTTVPQLNQAISAVSLNSATTGATKNYVATLSSSAVNDLVNLQSHGLAGAYEQIAAVAKPGAIGATSAFQYLHDASAAPVVGGAIVNATAVGIVDTGVASTHPEFAGVDFGASPANGLVDTDGHGTKVAGIIAAGCLTCTGAVYPTGPPFQMNGIAFGIPVPGGAIRIESRNWGGGTFAEVATAINNLMALKPPFSIPDVVLVAWGWEKESAPGTCATGGTHTCLPSAEFDSYASQLAAMFRSFAGTTFVVAAGNAGGPTENTVPACLSSAIPRCGTVPKGTLLPSTDNVITVGSTDLNDRACNSSPSGCAASSNTGVDIAAPGTAVYTTGILNTYDPNFGGTSAAAAMVAGTAALMHAVQPRVSFDGAVTRNLLRVTADTIADTGAGSKRVNLACAVGACLVDVFLLLDTTGSMGGSIKGAQFELGNVTTDLTNSGVNVDFGVGFFRDYPLNSYGSPGDVPYARVTDIKPLTHTFITDAEYQATQTSLNTLFAGGGADGPEAQLPALYQAATGAGQPPYVQPNLQVNWRTCPGTAPCKTLRVIVLVTDAPFNVGSPYPGPDFQTTISALNAKGIKVIGVQPNYGGSQATADLQRIAIGTGTVATTKVDCLGDGTQIVQPGQPLVCLTKSDGTGVRTAIVNAIMGLINP